MCTVCCLKGESHAFSISDFHNVFRVRIDDAAVIGDGSESCLAMELSWLLVVIEGFLYEVLVSSTSDIVMCQAQRDVDCALYRPLKLASCQERIRGRQEHI